MDAYDFMMFCRGKLTEQAKREFDKFCDEKITNNMDEEECIKGIIDAALRITYWDARYEAP